MRLLLLFLLMLATHALADDRTVIGGDAYVGGGSAVLSDPSPRDAFLAGFSADLLGRVEKDANAVGFNVDFDAPVGGDIHAAGFSVKIAQPVGEDVTAAGFSIYIREQAAIGGNARLSAGTITLDAPVAGSLIATAGTMTINQAVAGDARLTGGKIIFGPAAKIGGRLAYFAPEPIVIPPSVITADRVSYTKLGAAGAASAAREAAGQTTQWFWPSMLGLLIGFALTIGFLVAVAALLLALAPGLVERLRGDAAAAPFRSMLMGLIGMGMLIGLVPVAAMTLVGIPLIPFVILAAIVLWTLGYLLGAYSVSVRAAKSFREIPETMAGRLVILALGLAVIATLNFIPIIGWLINLAIVFIGLGAIVSLAFPLITARPASR